ncbi:MAG: hypothetical protein CBD77_04370 [bacterium TMED217]|nr:MAG: hypothetical protein CBD77_04370 [bacterium TMED217]
MKYYKNDLLINENAPDMGKGILLEDSDYEQNVKVYFFDLDEKKILSRKYASLKKIEEDKDEELFDNFDHNPKYQSFETSVVTFQKKMPGGFHGEEFARREREYKDKSHQLSQELLSFDSLSKLLSENDYTEISKRALSIVNKTNLIFKQEKISLKNGLDDEEGGKKFALALFDLLHGKDDIMHRFQSFVKMLEEIESNKWTIATYFLFIHYPNEHMFIKPTNTKLAAKITGWNIHYDARPNWDTYKHVLELSGYVYKKLEDLKPRDFIDVQSFFWIIQPSYK